jgi:hypothetical protein
MISPQNFRTLISTCLTWTKNIDPGQAGRTFIQPPSTSTLTITNIVVFSQKKEISSILYFTSDILGFTKFSV